MMKPLTDLNELITDYWPDLLPGFLKVLEYTNGDQDISKIMRELMTRELMCWVVPGTDGRLIDGLATTKIEVTRTCPVQNHLLIYHSWVHRDVQPLTYTHATQEFFEEYARRMECSRIKVMSMRDIGRWMENWGFAPSYTEYTKEVTP